ncbi:two-component response regulator [Bordetella ansorpii]|uniref:Two-component response regulator n=1 Tax=Bordetella ansorpii TaxID=288768 RepID=A0A157SSU1_9BORD|nr:EAL domain-containing protein [Bordetella ansorpii]SAI73213.1 two-component response regulator [Bordetella ansorpii]
MSPRDSRPTLGSVLVVDDSAVQRRMAAALCRQLGALRVHEAGDGVQALDLIATLAAPPDLMIVDIEMPHMDGIELIEALRIRGTETDIIIASGRESALIDSVLAIGNDLGVSVLAGLEKPLTLDALSEALSRRATRRGRFSPASGRTDAMPMTPAMLEAALRDDQIAVHFQPKADMHTGLVRGMEALARWMHPELGAISPGQFIPSAEQCGLIQPLTFRVLEQSLRQLSIWNSRGLRLSIAVNLSPRLLDWPGLTQDLMRLVQHSEATPEQICFEITESSVVDSHSQARGLLARLRLRGFGLSIDDYGTGFSSMQQLTRIPFTELKIDRAFVRHSNERKNLRVILKSAIDMARQLGVVSVAEGIETMEEWRLLQQLGCHVGQGFFIGKPMTGAEVPRWMRRHAERIAELREPPARAPIAD